MGVVLWLFVFCWMDEGGVLYVGMVINFELLISFLLLLIVVEFDEDDELEGCLLLLGECFLFWWLVGVLLWVLVFDGLCYEIVVIGWLVCIF